MVVIGRSPKSHDGNAFISIAKAINKFRCKSLAFDVDSLSNHDV